jgi:hypothetical protein
MEPNKIQVIDEQLNSATSFIIVNANLYGLFHTRAFSYGNQRYDNPRSYALREAMEYVEELKLIRDGKKEHRVVIGEY